MSSQGTGPEDIVQLCWTHVYCWDGPKAGGMLVGSHLGQLLLTERTLAFVSLGKVTMLRHLLGYVTMPKPAQVEEGVSLIYDVNLRRDRPGSFEVRPQDVRECVAVKRWDQAMYLKLTITSPNGLSREVALMNKLGMPWAYVEQWADEINARRGAGW